VKALVATGHEQGLSMRVLEAVEAVNADQKRLLVSRLVGLLGEDLTGVTCAIWGLAFKPNTDDMREAPAVEIIRGLLARGARIRAYDPIAIDNTREILGETSGVEFVDDQYAAVDGADALLLVTEWGEFRQPDFDVVKARMRGSIILDGRNIWTPSRMREAGFTYLGVGRP
jgi:UDPglucose 6-dehydrogenase